MNKKRKKRKISKLIIARHSPETIIAFFSKIRNNISMFYVPITSFIVAVLLHVMKYV